ncbi:hypothetical protein H6503_01665 [Candidatus Woesearchaeota archaeon]|nr:hypothetical protein [Candidatus Woesearchaeota archaeon]
MNRIFPYFFFLLIAVLCISCNNNEQVTETSIEDLSALDYQSCSVNLELVNCISIVENDSSVCNKLSEFPDLEEACLIHHYKVRSIIDKTDYCTGSGIIEDYNCNAVLGIISNDYEKCFEESGKVYCKAMAQGNIDACEEDDDPGACKINYYFLEALEKGSEYCKNLKSDDPESGEQIYKKCIAITTDDEQECKTTLGLTRCLI